MGIERNIGEPLVFGPGERASLTLVGRATEQRATGAFVSIGQHARSSEVVSAPDVASELKIGVGAGWSRVWLSPASETRETHLLGAGTEVWGVRLVPGVRVSARALAGAIESRAHADFLRAPRHTDRAVETMRVAEHVLSLARVDERVRDAMEAADRVEATTVEALADLVHASPRHLGRIFAEVVGVAPKRALAILRLRRALRLARSRAFSWARVAAEAGYADQSHLGREFRALLGQSPEAFLRAMEGG